MLNVRYRRLCAAAALFVAMAMGLNSIAMPQRPIKIMTWNICHCAADYDNDATIDPVRTAGVIKAAAPDFVCLQEVDVRTKRSGGVDQATRLAELTGMNSVFARAIDFEAGAYGVAILSKDKAVSTNRAALAGDEARVLLVCEFADMFIATAHLDNNAAKRLASLETVTNALAECAAAKPVFFMGDLNATPQSETMLALKRFATVLTPESDIATLNSRQGKGDYVIDYITLDNAHANSVLVKDAFLVEERKASDHAPLCVELMLSRSRPTPGPALAERLACGPDVIAIMHFGLNTYTDKEWGYGDEAPALFDPANFDAARLVSELKSGGIGGVVLVAKHHDGFCLWPTKTTDYNIAKSPFRGGKGDLVREMAEACRAAGLKFGIYVSPWDRNNQDYGTDKYVQTYHEQLRELASGDYGEIFEAWFDGANGGGGWYGGAKGKRTIARDYYRFGELFRKLREWQRSVTIFAEEDASDFRYPGNERGMLSPDSRATVVACGGLENRKFVNPEYPKYKNKGKSDGEFFRVCEADFPLRKGWFYHERDKGTAKNPAYLAKIYCGTVGNGGTMNIGIAPRKDGALDAEDVRALRGFKIMKDALFANEVRAGEPFNVVELRENLANGEQVDAWRILADGREIFSGKAIGSRRIRLIEKPVAAKDVRLEITKDGGMALPVSMKLYHANEELVAAILTANADSGETDTAKWMEGKEVER